MLPLSEFLALYPKPATRDAYGQACRRFLDCVYGIAKNHRSRTDYEALSIRYLQEDRDLLSDLREFVAWLGKHYAPKSAELFWAGTLVWLGENGRELSAREQKRLASRLPKGGAQTIDSPIDHAFLRQILPHMSIMGRALVLFLASSGTRIGETLLVRVDALDLDADPPRFEVRGRTAKGGAPRRCYLTREAAETIREWLKVRDRYLQSSVGRNAGLVRAGLSKPKSPTDDRLFPVTERTCWDLWERALSAAGLDQRDPETRRLKRSFHGLRKFFLSQAKLVIPAEIPEALAGHRGYLTEAYRRYTETQLEEYYRQAEPRLTVMAPAEVREIQSEFRQRMQAHSEILESLVAENIDLKKRIQSIEELQARMDQISMLVARYEAD